MLNLQETKALTLVLMAALTLAMSLLPLYIRRILLREMHEERGQVALSGCLCFGAGVLLSIVFLHLLPETQDSIRYAMDVGYMKRSTYPACEAIVCCGFFFVYLVEEVIHSYVGHHQKWDEVEVTSEGPSSLEEAKREAKLKRLSVGRFSGSRASSETRSSTVLSVAGLVGTRGRTNECFEGGSYFGERLESQEPPPRHNVHTIPHCHHDSPMNSGTTVLGAVVVVVALSFHSIMEGLVVGLEDEAADVWMLFGALCAHKLCISFSMAMELLEVGVSFKPFLASMVVFSLASPLGGVIGLLVVDLSEEETAEAVLVPAVLQAVSAGTILYVIFCEVLERERSRSTGSRVRFVTLVLGFGVMAALESIGGHDHGHNVAKNPSVEPLTTTPTVFAG